MTAARLIPVLCALALTSCAHYAQRDTISQSIDAMFSDYTGFFVPGASVAVIKDGAFFYRKAYGMANIEADIPASTVTNYRLASVTKQFTATATLMLVNRGLLSLDSRVTDVLPGAPATMRNVTIRHLLSHTSGIVDYEDLIPDSVTAQVHDKDVLMLLQSIDSVYFPAGAKFKYSNSGYALLALIVEAVSHQSFAAFLRDNIFVPLGMNRTVAYEEAISTVEHRAYGYSHTDSGFVRTDQSVTSAVLGDGGIYSSVEDLFKWDQALYTETLLPAPLFKQALTPATLNDGSHTAYGFGWYIDRHETSTWYLHEGSTRGFRNAILRLPDQKISIIVLTNRNEGEPIKIARKIAEMLLAKRVF
jgi:CubicO group peptidase (beta-lactamase class C family)